MMESTFSLKTSRILIVLYVFRIKHISLAASCSGLGQLENGRTFFRYGGIYASFACNPGYSLLGHLSNSCVRGRWRKPLPVCIASGCYMPAGIAYGILQMSNNDAVITVTCKKGYKLIGPSMMYCNGKKWNSTIPVCRETDMRSSSLQKKNSETERTFVVASSLFKKDTKMVLFNGTENMQEHSGIISIPNDVTEMGPQRQLQSPNIYLEVEGKKSLIQPSLKGLNVTKITSTVKNIAQTHFRKNVTSSYSWSSSVTHIPNSKITQKRNQSSQIKANPYSTTGLLGFKDSQSTHSHFVKHEKSVPTDSSVGSPLHLGNPTSNAPQTTQQIQSKYLSALSENETPANMSPNNYVTNLLAGVLETILKTITPLKQLYNTTNVPEDSNIKIKANEPTPAQMLTGITPSQIYYSHTLPVQIQTAQTPIVEMQTAHVEDTNSTDQDTRHNVTSADTEYKAIFTESTNLSKLSNVKLYSIQKTSSTRTLETTATAITSISGRKSKNLGVLIRAFKRKVQCVYPLLPSHGTFRFLTIRNPLPNQYPYYIQYSCYPGYTMSTGDEHSLCKDNGEWSGLTPVCELEENIPTQ